MIDGGSSFGSQTPADGPDVALMSWGLVPAYHGSGSWLVASGPSEVRAWAPPGVALINEDQEPVQSWTHAQWHEHAHPPATPHYFCSLSLINVLDAVPADFASWAQRCTNDTIRVLELYVSTASDPSDGFVSRALLNLATLRAELADAKQRADELDRDINVSGAEHAPATALRLPPGAPTPCSCATEHLTDVPGVRPVEALVSDEVFRAFSDVDFSRLVAGVMSSTLATRVTPAYGIADVGIDTLVADMADRYCVVCVAHHSESTADALLSTAARSLRQMRLSSRLDECWLVTSRALTGSLRQALSDLVAFLSPGKQHVVGPDWLEERIAHDATALAEDVKLRVAQSSAGQDTLSRFSLTARLKLPQITVTDSVGVARRQLHANRMIFISGASGMGKTALAQLLAADGAIDGLLPRSVDATSMYSLLARFDPDAPHVIVCDDARVRNDQLLTLARFLAERTRWQLIATVSGSKPASGCVPFLFEIPDYTPVDRARILYNHVRHAEDLNPATRAAFGERRHYWPVVNHPQFTPRLVEELAASGPHIVRERMAHAYGCLAARGRSHRDRGSFLTGYCSGDAASECEEIEHVLGRLRALA